MYIHTDPSRVIARGWFVADAYAAVRWRFLEVLLGMQNLGGSSWREAQFGNRSCTRAEAAAGCTGVADVHFTPGIPFNLMLGLKLSF